jgi:hypothetical protein
LIHPIEQESVSAELLSSGTQAINFSCCGNSAVVAAVAAAAVNISVQVEFSRFRPFHILHCDNSIIIQNLFANFLHTRVGTKLELAQNSRAEDNPKN